MNRGQKRDLERQARSLSNSRTSSSQAQSLSSIKRAKPPPEEGVKPEERFNDHVNRRRQVVAATHVTRSVTRIKSTCFGARSRSMTAGEQDGAEDSYHAGLKEV